MDDRYETTMTLGPDGPGVSLFLTQDHANDVAGLMRRLAVRDAEMAAEATQRTVPDGTTRETLLSLYRLTDVRLWTDYKDGKHAPSRYTAKLSTDATVVVLEYFHQLSATEDDLESETEGSM